MSMDKKQTQIITLMVIGVVFNGYSAVKAGKSVTKDIMGGFIATTLLLALAEGVPVVAEALAGAFMVTSVLTAGVSSDPNGRGLITDLTSMVTNTPTSPANGNSVTAAATDPGSGAGSANAAEHDQQTVVSSTHPTAGTGAGGTSRTYAAGTTPNGRAALPQ